MSSSAEVLDPEDETRNGGVAVPPGTPELLVVRVERRRRVDMEHPAHVGLVDAHPERNGRRDDASGAVEVRSHRLAAAVGCESGVVKGDTLPGGCENVVGVLCGCVRRRVDDPRPVELGRRLFDFAALVAHRLHVPRLQADVRPVEVAHDDVRVSQPQTATDLLSYRRSCRRRQRHPHVDAERVRLRSDPQVVGAEVVPPLADQVRLVDCEQSRASTPQNFTRLPVRELFWRQKHECLRSAGRGKRRRMLARRLVRVENDRCQAGGAEVRKLVLLQRDQRRNDDGRTLAHHPGKFIDRRLTPAGRKNGKDVTPRHRRFDRTTLARPQTGAPEPLSC